MQNKKKNNAGTISPLKYLKSQEIDSTGLNILEFIRCTASRSRRGIGFGDIALAFMNLENYEENQKETYYKMLKAKDLESWAKYKKIISKPTLVKYLNLLFERGLINKIIKGRNTYYQLNKELRIRNGISKLYKKYLKKSENFLYDPELYPEYIRNLEKIKLGFDDDSENRQKRFESITERDIKLNEIKQIPDFYKYGNSWIFGITKKSLLDQTGNSEFMDDDINSSINKISEGFALLIKILKSKAINTKNLNILLENLE